MGPKQIHKGRLEYNEAIQESFREEILLNLVRLRYRETPDFISIGGIAAQYTFDGAAGGSLTLPDGGTKVGGLNGAVARTERPTISYVPARGEAFQKGILAPIDLQSLQLLARTGWSWERILRTTVQYMNQVDNATSAGGPTPELKPNYEQFRYLAKLMRQLQTQREIELTNAERETTPKTVPLSKERLNGDFVIEAVNSGYRFKDDGEKLSLVKDEKYAALVVHPRAKFSTEMREIAELLDLKVDYESSKPALYEVVSAREGWIQSTFENAPDTPVELIAPQGESEGVLPAPSDELDLSPLRDDVVISTRSLLEVMFYLSHGINVPLEHQACGLVTLTVDESGEAFDWNEMFCDLFTVRACDQCPKHAAVAVQYRDHWFYIDERDKTSLATFSLLVELFGIEVQAGGGGGFLYTIGI
jgi:hypothetical protein